MNGYTTPASPTRFLAIRLHQAWLRVVCGRRTGHCPGEDGGYGYQRCVLCENWMPV